MGHADINIILYKQVYLFLEFIYFWLMDANEFQRELGDIQGALLHGPAKALVISWNQRTAKILNRIVPMGLLLTLWSRHSPWFTEELQVLKRAKWLVEHLWRKTRYESDCIQVKAAIKVYLMAVRVAKLHYFLLLLHLQSVTLFRITQSL